MQQQIGVTDVTITYHRPLVNGRKIWGALVPYDKVWRAGANFNTTFDVSMAYEMLGMQDAPFSEAVHAFKEKRKPKFD